MASKSSGGRGEIELLLHAGFRSKMMREATNQPTVRSIKFKVLMMFLRDRGPIFSREKVTALDFLFSVREESIFRGGKLIP